MKYSCKKSQYYSYKFHLKNVVYETFVYFTDFYLFNMFHVCNIPKLDSKHNKALMITKT